MYRSVSRGLESEGYAVTCVHDGIDGESLAMTGRLIDPFRHDAARTVGIEILKTFRTTDSRTPVIMLTAKTEVTDRVTGLDAGATDYVTKTVCF